MNDKSAKVVLGFTQLNITERADVIKAINDFLASQKSQQELLEESFAKKAGVDLGPMDSSGCPCCGK